MSKTYRDWSPNQAYMFPPAPQDWLPEDDLVYFILDNRRGRGASRLGWRRDRGVKRVGRTPGK